jgi:uncharacterized phage-associated protein
MKTCSQAVANHILDLSRKESEEKYKNISLLKIMKLVYIVHGYSLALADKGALNPNFDTVEAWRYGPVIPSLYHELKRFGGDNIPKDFKSEYLDLNTLEKKTANLSDPDIEKVSEFVWDIYKKYSATDLVNILHEKGSPWDYAYVPGKNNPIPDEDTKDFFKLVVKNSLK